MGCIICGNTDPIITELGREDKGEIILYFKSTCPFCQHEEYWKEIYQFDYAEALSKEEIKAKGWI